MTCFRAYQMWH